MFDTRRRPLADLRLSVTDHCNFRCPYCMPRGSIGARAAGSGRLLDFDEMTRIAEAFVDLGVTKIRLTGGEPLVRRDLPRLVERLRQLPIRDLCLTTNGSLLSELAPALAAAGLGRVTVSLDALDDTTFQLMTDGKTSVGTVLQGIDAARRHGLTPVKVNMVVQRGVNEHALLPMAAWARREGLELRFIEYMDVGCSNGWRPTDVLTAQEIRERIHANWPLEATEPGPHNETASRHRYAEGGGRIGLIASVSQPFCGQCTRARVSCRGELYLCLFASNAVDLAAPLRQGEDLRTIVAASWRHRADRYSELRAIMPSASPRPEMSAIGG